MLIVYIFISILNKYFFYEFYHDRTKTVKQNQFLGLSCVTVENVLFTSVTSNEIVEKNNDFYVFEKRNDLVLAIDNEGSETTIKEFTDATTEATLDSLIDRLVESLK